MQGAPKHAASRRAQLRTAVQSFAAGREASERPTTSTGGGSGLRLPLLPAGRDVVAMYGSLRLPEVDVRRFYLSDAA